ncbi:hypothetical protein [Salipiger abyssi]|uniref:hypothetical protein n=1 Tax=Salipiger abyssi TaxID=1250539 RepID=UPI004059115F
MRVRAHTLAAAAVLSALGALPASADRIACALHSADGTPVDLRFDIDRRQFAPPTSPDEPPKKLRSYVIQNGTQYVAEPFLMEGGVRGFWAEDRRQGQALLVIGPDGRAEMTDAAFAAPLQGRCEDVE